MLKNWCIFLAKSGGTQSVGGCLPHKFPKVGSRPVAFMIIFEQIKIWKRGKNRVILLYNTPHTPQRTPPTHTPTHKENTHTHPNTPPHTHTPRFCLYFRGLVCPHIYSNFWSPLRSSERWSPKMVKHDVYGVFSQCFARTRVCLGPWNV